MKSSLAAVTRHSRGDGYAWTNQAWQQDEEIAGRTYPRPAMQKDEQDPLALPPLLSAVVFAGSCAFWSEGNLLHARSLRSKACSSQCTY